MFERLIRLSRARKALRDRRFEEALQLAGDPVVAADRRAESVRLAAIGELVARVRRRLEQGDVAAARADLVLLRQAGAPDCAALELEAQRAADTAAARADQRSRDLAAARRQLEAGELAAAEALAQGLEEADPDRRFVLAAVAEQRRRATETAQQASQCLEGGGVEAAIDRLEAGLALDRASAALAAVRVRLGEQAAAGLLPPCRRSIQAGDLIGALRRFGRVARRLSGGAVDPLQQLHEELVEAVVGNLRRCTSLDSASSLLDAADASLHLPPKVAAVALALKALPAGRSGFVPEAEYAALLAAGKALGCAGLVAVVERLGASSSLRATRLASAQQNVAAGDLESARAQLAELLLEAPTDEVLRRELELVDRGLAELDQRLDAARVAMRAGRLGEACSTALGLCGNRRLAVAAQQLVTDARARMSLVDRGLDEVRVALHGRGAATAEGVAHCLRRLQELVKVQTDHPELPRVIAAVGLELEQLAELERARTATEQRLPVLALDALQRVFEHRSGLLAPDRLDARFCDRADEAGRLVDAALLAGRLEEADAAAERFAGFAAVRADYPDRAEAWRHEAARRREHAQGVIDRARASLVAKDLAEAERLAEEAQTLWRDSPAVRALVGDLRRVRHQAEVLDRVADLAAEQDFVGAGRKLAGMPAASPFLRTRIYDMKQDLARAQGLDGTFLLRVDEGGEHLVLRSDTVSFGNVRQARADVPVLAQLAGCHASIRRSMSFHGGMQDTIVAEEGEIAVAGRPVSKHVLAPGDRLQLGVAFGFVYQRPSRRSLTAALTLQSGFRVASTDRLLLMKDRGRDGRILLGPGSEVHVRVARATGEVELFAANSGQMRVFCEAGGTIDGAPFRGEHPVAAGQIVEANGISFQLMPWHRPQGG